MDALKRKRTSIAIITDKNDLAIPLSMELIKNDCQVDIITSKSWSLDRKVATDKVKFLNVLKLSDVKKSTKYRYTIFIRLFQEINKKSEEIKEETSLEDSLNIISVASSKLLFIFPLGVTYASKRKIDSLKEKYLSQEGKTTAVLYIGDLTGPLIDTQRKDIFSQALKNVVENRTVSIPRPDTYFYPVDIKAVAVEAVRNLFSFGVYGKEAAVESGRISGEEFVDILKTKIPQLKINRIKIIKSTANLQLDERIFISGKPEELIIQSFNKTAKNKRLAKRDLAEKKKEKKVKRKRVYFYRLFLLSIMAIIIPFSSAILSTSSLVFANKQIRKGNTNFAKGAYRLSHSSARFTINYLNAAQKVPGGKVVLSTSIKTAGILAKASETGLILADSADIYQKLLDKIFGEERYDPYFYTENLSLELDNLFNQTGFLIGETGSFSGMMGKVMTGIVNETLGLNERKNLISLRNFIKEGGETLGAKEKKSYLLLFQDNQERRPAGGTIKSIALINLEGGRLIDYEIYNASFADAQIKGYVEPPQPLQKYLSLDRWLLKDSNWDADFPSSASQAEWFLDKGVDRGVDGVIAIDLEFIRGVIGITGPVIMEDEESEIKEKNLYEAMLGKEEEDFTALLEELFQRLPKIRAKNKIKLTLELLEGLQKKHVQIFFHNNKTQSSITELNWGGSIKQGRCEGNCMYQWLGLVEADFDNTVSGTLIEKRAAIDVNLEEGIAKTTFTLLIRDSRNSSENSKKYRGYIKVISPSGNGYSPVIIRTKEGEEVVSPEITEIRGRIEAGVYLELEPGETKILVFSWEGKSRLNFNKKGEYQLLWRKQAGTKGFPVEITVNSPVEFTHADINKDTLTIQTPFKYNTNLSRDLVSRIYWK